MEVIPIGKISVNCKNDKVFQFAVNSISACWAYSCKHNFFVNYLPIKESSNYCLVSGMHLLLLDYVQTGRLLPHKRIWQHRLILLCSRLFTLGYNKIYMREKGYLWYMAIRNPWSNRLCMHISGNVTVIFWFP